MNICELSEVASATRECFKVNSVGILSGIINPYEYYTNKNLFQFIDYELNNRTSLLDKTEESFSQSNSIFILTFLLLLFIAIALTDTGTLLEFNANG